MAATIRRFVECESPSDDASAVSRFVELVSDTLAFFAKVKTYPGGKFGRLLVAEMQLPGRRKSGQVLALGHSDTVWPVGTLRTMPFRQADGRLWGPGVLDMKAGIVFFLFAVRALRELDIAVGSKVLLQLNPDEEVGSQVSRALTEKNAARSKAVLVLEPGTGLTGKLKTARKGVGDFRVVVKGRASHSGVDFEAGALSVAQARVRGAILMAISNKFNHLLLTTGNTVTRVLLERDHELCSAQTEGFPFGAAFLGVLAPWRAAFLAASVPAVGTRHAVEGTGHDRRRTGEPVDRLRAGSRSGGHR